MTNTICYGTLINTQSSKKNDQPGHSLSFSVFDSAGDSAIVHRQCIIDVPISNTMPGSLKSSVRARHPTDIGCACWSWTDQQRAAHDRCPPAKMKPAFCGVKTKSLKSVSGARAGLLYSARLSTKHVTSATPIPPPTKPSGFSYSGVPTKPFQSEPIPRYPF